MHFYLYRFVCFTDRVALVAPPTYAHHYYPYCYYPHHGLGGGGGGGGGGLIGGGGGHHGGHMQQPIYSRCPPGILYNIFYAINYLFCIPSFCRRI